MACVRCGAVFDGSFCPRCGAPAAASPTSFAAPPAPVGWPCPRCGTLFSGNFCPRCGLPMGAWAARPPPRSSMRPVLSILWTMALVAFVAFALTDFAGLAVSPTLIVPGIQGIQSGQTVNSGMEFSGNWTHDSWGTASTSSYQASGGHPYGFLEMRLFGTNARGYWWQSFNVSGSQPYTGSVHLDLQIVGGLTSGQLIVSVDSSNSAPDPNVAIAVLSYSGPTPWTSTGRIGADARLTSRGLYYLKIAFIVDAASGPVDVGIDNARLAWTTDAAVVLYIPVPLPYVVILSQDKTFFLSYYGLIAATIFIVGAYHAVRERKETSRAFKAPIESIGTRLRSRSAWIAIAQVWMAVTFFQVALIYLLTLAGIEPTSPINLTPQNAWVLLFELANAGVYEEVIFRLLLIGLPMAVGSVVVGLEALISLVFIGLAIAGAGFLVWYVIDAWRHLMGLVARFRPPTRVPTVPPPTTFATPVPPPFAVSPTLSPSPPAGSWSPGLPVASPGTAFRDPGRIPREYTPSFTPPPYGYPPVRFQCPFCGWVEARYDSGRFTCTRCGRSA